MTTEQLAPPSMLATGGRFMGRVKRVHFVGVGGAGMCGIAEVLASEGFAVSGSDMEASATTRHLQRVGVEVQIGHKREHVRAADVVVVSAAVPPTNVEIVHARALGIAVIPRAEMLGELMRYRIGVAVAGSHGKTTTTSMIAAMFEHAGADPTYVIGGVLRGRSGNARFGEGPHLIAEADESDASFLHLLPQIAVVTNIDRDHLVAYDGDFGHLKDAFIRFAQRLPFFGALLACADDAGVADILPALSRPVLTYGIEDGRDYRATSIRAEHLDWRFTALRPAGHAPIEVAVSPPGAHNVLNALAAVATATELGLSDDAIASAMENFHGVGRRFEIHPECMIEGKRFTLVDDYGHHPREIAAVIDTARQLWPRRRLVMAFQPHRYSRTHHLFDAFVDVLSRVDALVLLQTYAAGEPAIDGAKSCDLFQGLCRAGSPAEKCMAAKTDDAGDALAHLLQGDDVLLVQGAGNVNRLTEQITSGQLTEVREQCALGAG